MQDRLKEKLNNPKVLAAGLILLAVMLSCSALFVNSRYVFRSGLSGLVVDRYETGTEQIEAGEDKFLDETVAEGSFRVHINHLPKYDNKKYNLQIWNPEKNNYLMRVTVVQTKNGTEVTVLKTDLIRTGYKLEEVALKDAQEGAATAIFTAYDKETLEEVGTVEVELTLPATN